MAITTRARAKAILGISTASTEHDDQIDALIPQVEGHYLAIRNRPFDVGTVVEFQTAAGLTSGMQLVIEIGDYSLPASTAQRGSEYGITLRANDTADIIARRVANQILPSPYYSVVAPPAATSTAAEVRFVEKFETFTEQYSVLDITVDPSTAIPPAYTATVSPMQTLYPDGAEFTAAQMVQYHIGSAAGGQVQSETLGDYSVTFAQSESGDYPKSITSKIRRFARTL